MLRRYDQYPETTTLVSPYNYALNNPVMFVDPDGRKVVASETVEVFFKKGGLWDFFMHGGYAVFASYNDFVAADSESGMYSNFSSGIGSGARIQTPTFGDTQAFRDIMAYLAQPEYFQGIDFERFGGGQNDCPTCPKKATDGQIYSEGFKGYQYREGEWTELEAGEKVVYKGKFYLNPSVKFIGGAGPLEYISGVGELRYLLASKSALKTFKSTEIGAQSVEKVQKLAKLMREGDLAIYSEKIVVYLKDGKRYILDGHHRIEAAIQESKTLEVIEVSGQKALEMFGDKIKQINAGLFK